MSTIARAQAPCGHSVEIDVDQDVWTFVDCSVCPKIFEYRLWDHQLEWADLAGEE